MFHSLTEEGKKPAYFSGGTEIITLGRSDQFFIDAIIDIKLIPECLVSEISEDAIHFGAALSLTNVIETNHFPLLSETLAEIADHTARNKITLGGNICGNIPYREAVLPFLITNSQAIIASRTGLKEVPLQSVFNEKLRLKEEEMLVSVKLQKTDAALPFVSIKKRRIWNVGYPLITAVAVLNHGKIEIALSGLCNFPFHHTEIDANLTSGEKIQHVINAIPAPLLDDVHGSSRYRQFVLENILVDIFDTLKEAK